MELVGTLTKKEEDDIDCKAEELLPYRIAMSSIGSQPEEKHVPIGDINNNFSGFYMDYDKSSEYYTGKHVKFTQPIPERYKEKTRLFTRITDGLLPVFRVWDNKLLLKFKINNNCSSHLKNCKISIYVHDQLVTNDLICVTNLDELGFVKEKETRDVCLEIYLDKIRYFYESNCEYKISGKYNPIYILFDLESHYLEDFKFIEVGLVEIIKGS